MSQSLADQRWGLSLKGGTALVTLQGDWIGADAVVNPDQVAGLLAHGAVTSVAFDSSLLRRWDSSLLLFLSELRRFSVHRNIVFEQSGFPPAACKLLDLLPVDTVAAAPPFETGNLIGRVGQWCLNRGSELRSETALLGALTLRIAPAVRRCAGSICWPPCKMRESARCP